MSQPNPATQLHPGSLLLAPMVELSHRPLRVLIEQWGGCDRYHTEMCSAAAWMENTAYERWFLDTQPAPDRTFIQFYGTKVEDIPAAAVRIARQHAEHNIPLAGIDINFGCSAPHIERSGGGVAWMRDRAGSARIVQLTRQAQPVTPLSAKLRLGYKEDHAALLDYCLALCEAGLNSLTLHPRLKHEKFRRLSRWDHVQRLAERLPIPVYGNGDIRTPDDYLNAMERWRPAGIMLGREAVRRPWIFRLIKGRIDNPDWTMQVDLENCAITLLDLIEQELPEVFHLSRARRFLWYFADNLSFGHHLRFAVQNAPTMLAIRNLVAEYFVASPSERVKTER